RNVTQHKPLDRRKANSPASLLNCNALKTGSANKGGQFVGIGQPKWRAHYRCRSLTHVSLQGLRQHGKTGTFVYSAPHHQCEPSLGTKNPAHLAQRCGPICKELQAELAIDDVERTVR